MADPASTFYAGNLKLNWASPALNGNAAVNGGPILGLQGLYYTAGDGSLRCVFANAVPDLANVVEQRAELPLPERDQCLDGHHESPAPRSQPMRRTILRR